MLPGERRACWTASAATFRGAVAAAIRRRRARSERRLRPDLLALEGRSLLSTFTVTSAADSAPAGDPVANTMRWAVEQADNATSPSAIEIQLGTSAATITLQQGQLELSNTTNSVAIYDGPGEGAVTISGNNSSRVFLVNDGVTASFSGLTIADGYVRNFNPGAGLDNDGGTVTLTDCTISGNSAVFITTGIVNGFYNSTGGGVYSENGTLNLYDSTVSGNYAYAGGGGLGLNGGSATLNDCTISGNSCHLNSGGVDDGSFGHLTNGSIGHNDDTTATLTGCTISGNSAYYGSALANYATATITNGTITGCTADRGGGTVENDGTASISGCTISGNVGSGLENGNYFYRSASLTASNLTITGNSWQGVRNNAGTATLADCSISGNDSHGVAYGGGVENDGTLSLTDCTLSDDSADLGGGVENSGTATLADCTISGNSANGGGGLDNEEGTATLVGCTVSGNDGGGLYNSASVDLTNCTIAGNSAQFVGGVYDTGGSTATFTDCTVSGNTAETGGVGNAGGSFFSPPATATLTDTIVAANTTADGVASDIKNLGNLSGSYDMIGTGGSGGLQNGVNGNIVGVADPLLSPLGDYGGPTETIALLPGSPALGVGTPVGGVTTDQRGVTRPASGVDIGAFQSQGFTLAPVADSTPQTAALNSPFANPLAVAVTANDPAEPVAGGMVSFSAPPNGATATLSASSTVIGSNGVASVTATANGTAGTYAVTAAAGTAAPASFELTNSAGPVVVTGDLSVVYKPIVYNPKRHEYTQGVTITNIGDAPIAGPIELVLLDLANATLVNETGTYDGNPYITILASGPLGVGQSASIALIFAAPAHTTITYTAEFLSGPIPTSADSEWWTRSKRDQDESRSSLFH